MKTVASVFLLTLLVTLTACAGPAQQTGPSAGPTSAGEEPKYGKIATFAVRQDPPAGFDRMKTTIYYDIYQAAAPTWGVGNVVRLCLEDIYKICPNLAESWESSTDFGQWTFKVRDGVTWHDGQAFTAEDAKFWFDTVQGKVSGAGKTRRPAIFAGNFGEFKSVEVVDRNKVRITLAQPEPAFLFLISQPDFSIGHPRHLSLPRIEKGEVDLTPQDLEFMGTGPFKFLKYEKGSRFQVRKYDKYWEKDAQGRSLPYLDGIDLAVISAPAMDAAFFAGQLDGGAIGAGHALLGERKAQYEQRFGDQVKITAVGSGYAGLGFNVIKPGPWQDKRVRQAVSRWIDKEAAMEAGGLAGLAQPIAVVHPKAPYANQDFLEWPGWNRKTRDADRQEAKRLLAEAGYAGGFSEKIPCYTQPTYMRNCVFLQGQLKDLGINLDIVQVDEAEYSRTKTSIDYALASSGGISVPYAPLPQMAEPWIGVYSKFPIALEKHEDPRITQYFDQLRRATTAEQQSKIWSEFERYFLLDQAYFVPYYMGLSATPYRSYVKGGVFSQPEVVLAAVDYGHVWLDK